MIYVHLATGFEEVEATTIVDILRRGGAQVQLVSIQEEKAVTGAHGMVLQADITFEEADYSTCEMIVLPGGLPGTYHLQDHVGLTEQIKSFAAQEKWIAAMCAAPMIFGALGLLEGKEATIYPGMEKELVGAIAVTTPVAISGKVITSQAPGTAMLFALALLGAVAGEAVMEEVREGLKMQ
ncbi:MAG: DJ-1/PfpI family protein [Anaerovoracaceae bacterium]